MFKNSDEKLFRFIDFIKTTIIILAFLVGALAIFNIVVGAIYSYPEQIVTGVIYLLMAIFAPIIGYIYVDFIAMLSYDLKTIRNKLYDIKNNSLNNLLRYDSDDNNSNEREPVLSNEQITQLLDKLQEYKGKDKN